MLELLYWSSAPMSDQCFHVGATILELNSAHMSKHCLQGRFSEWPTTSLGHVHFSLNSRKNGNNKFPYFECLKKAPIGLKGLC